MENDTVYVAKLRSEIVSLISKGHVAFDTLPKYNVT